MTRLFIAALLLAAAAAPALACPFGATADNDARPATVASQPATDQANPPPPAATTEQKPG
jgi:hypothetical protein